jgi:hypothetical protein
LSRFVYHLLEYQSLALSHCVRKSTGGP